MDTNQLRAALDLLARHSPETGAGDDAAVREVTKEAAFLSSRGVDPRKCVDLQRAFVSGDTRGYERLLAELRRQVDKM